MTIKVCKIYVILEVYTQREVLMKISEIKIQNFRLLSKLRLSLEDNLSLVLGKNNTGKTSILSVMRKFVGDSLYKFSYDDFNLNFRCDLFKAIVEKQKWESLNGDGIILTFYIKYNENDNISILSRLMVDDLDDKNDVVVLKFEYSLKPSAIEKMRIDYSEFEKNHPNKKIEKKDCFEAFMKAKHSKYFRVLIKSLDYDYEKNEEIFSSFSIIENNDRAIKELIAFKYISARRLVTNKETDGTLSNLSSRYYEKNESSEVHKIAIKEFEDTLITTDQQLNNVYNTIFESILGNLKKFGGIKENETDIKIVSSLQQKNLIKSNTTVVYNDENHLLPETYNGLGYLNLLNIIFELETILAELRMDGKDDENPSFINLLFIEEPEAHTHPQMQYVFIKNIKNILKNGTDGSQGKHSIDLQTIVTTHSSHIVSESDFDDIKYLCKSKDKIINAKNLKELELSYKGEKELKKKHFKFLKQYLTLNRAELFFADKAIFIEGDTERILIPAMMKKIDYELDEGMPLLSQNISVVEVGNYSHIFEPFIEFLGIKSLIITDIDSAKLDRVKDEKDGSVKENISGCVVEGSNITTNHSLKYFHSKTLKEYSKDSKERESYELEYFKTLDFKGKIFKKVSNEWIVDEDGCLAIVYQTAEENVESIVYNARSFEDSFFHINRRFIIDNIDDFRGLKNKSRFTDMESGQYVCNSYTLAEECVNGKPSFAMDILLNSELKKDEEFSNWATPSYIEEGLKWLK